MTMLEARHVDVARGGRTAGQAGVALVPLAVA